MARNTRTARPAADAMSPGAFAQPSMEIPAAARDFVKRGVDAARERAEQAHEGFAGAAGRAESAATAFVSDHADFTRAWLDASLANVRHALDAAEKVTAASSLTEAARIQSDYVRESTAANLERAREAAEAARARIADGAKSFQDGLSAFVSRTAA